MTGLPRPSLRGILLAAALLAVSSCGDQPTRVGAGTSASTAPSSLAPTSAAPDTSPASPGTTSPGTPTTPAPPSTDPSTQTTSDAPKQLNVQGWAVQPPHPGVEDGRAPRWVPTEAMAALTSVPGAEEAFPILLPLFWPKSAATAHLAIWGDAAGRWDNYIVQFVDDAGMTWATIHGSLQRSPYAAPSAAARCAATPRPVLHATTIGDVCIAPGTYFPDAYWRLARHWYIVEASGLLDTDELLAFVEGFSDVSGNTGCELARKWWRAPGSTTLTYYPRPEPPDYPAAAEAMPDGDGPTACT